STWTLPPPKRTGSAEAGAAVSASTAPSAVVARSLLRIVVFTFMAPSGSEIETEGKGGDNAVILVEHDVAVGMRVGDLAAERELVAELVAKARNGVGANGRTLLEEERIGFFIFREFDRSVRIAAKARH